MDTLIKADIFFFIASIAVVVMTIIALVVGFYVIRIVRNFRDISERIRDEAEEIEEDIATLRSAVKREGFKLRHLISFFFNLADMGSGRRARKRKRDEDR